MPQILHHAQRIARTRQHPRLAGVCRSRIPASCGHALDRIDLLPTLAEVHLVLQARQRSRVAIGIELVIEFEYHAQRVFGMRKRLQMPRRLSQEISSLGHLQPQVRDVAHLRNIRRVIQNFARSQWHAWVGLRRSHLRLGRLRDSRRSDSGGFARRIPADRWRLRRLDFRCGRQRGLWPRRSFMQQVIRGGGKQHDSHDSDSCLR